MSERSDYREHFAELFEPVEKDLYRMAFIYLGNREDALDCVQEAAWRCCRGFKKLREQEYFRTWAIRVTINCAKDILKSRRPDVGLEELSEPEEPSEDVENRVLDRLTLNELLDGLTPEERSAVVLRHALGCGFKEIAKILGVPPGTAKTFCYRAIEKLRRRYSE